MLIKPVLFDDARIIYEIKGQNNYIAKIFETWIPSNEEEEKSRIDNKYIRNIQNIQEIEVYKCLKDEDVVDCIYTNCHVKNTIVFLRIEKKVIALDFSNWVKDFKLIGPFTMIITKKHNGFVTLKNAIENKEIVFHNRIKTPQIQYYFIKIMRKILFLNRKYNFVHGDLLVQNVLINSGNIKLFDFDLSTVFNTVSMGQISYFDYHRIFPLSGRKGFLFDFARLFISISYYYNGKSFLKEFESENTFLNNLIDILTIYEDNYIVVANNAKLFDDWVKENGGIDNLYKNVIKFINLFSLVDPS